MQKDNSQDKPKVLDTLKSPLYDEDRINYFGGKIVRKNGALAFHSSVFQFFLPVAMGKAVWLQKVGEHEEVCIGVRAKHIGIGGVLENDDIGVLGNVEKKSQGGIDKCINVRIGGNRIIVKSEKDIEFNDGDAIRLHFSRNNAILFLCPLDSIANEAMPLALSAV